MTLQSLYQDRRVCYYVTRMTVDLHGVFSGATEWITDHRYPRPSATLSPPGL